MKKSTTALSALLFVSALLPGVVTAQYSGAGTYSFPELEICYDARTAALGGAGMALPNSSAGVIANPAALAFASGRQVSVGYRSLLGVTAVPVAGILPTGRGVFGFSAYGITSGKIEMLDDAGQDMGMVASANLYTVAASWGRKVTDYLGVGVNLKGVYERIGAQGMGATTSGVAIDAGVQGRFLNSRVIYGFAVQNIGTALSGYDKGIPLPLEVDMGVSYVPAQMNNVRLILDMNKKADDYLVLQPATEIELIRNQFLVRAGYNISWADFQYARDGLQGNSNSDYVKSSAVGLCAGVGVKTTISERYTVRFDASVEVPTVPLPPNLILNLALDL